MALQYVFGAYSYVYVIVMTFYPPYRVYHDLVYVMMMESQGVVHYSIIVLLCTCVCYNDDFLPVILLAHVCYNDDPLPSIRILSIIDIMVLLCTCIVLWI